MDENASKADYAVVGPAALRDLTSAHRAISRALASSGHSMMGPLFTLSHGHKVNLRYQVGNYMAEVVLKSGTLPVLTATVLCNSCADG